MTTRRDAPLPAGGSFVISVRAKPRSSVSALDQDASGSWVARLRSSPVDGKANAELIDLVARHFGCSRSCVALVSGASARLKLVRISAPAAAKRCADVLSMQATSEPRRRRF